MERMPTTSGLTAGNAAPDAVNAKIDMAATTAHRATDAIAETASAGVGKLSGSAHSAVDSAAAATHSLADSTSEISQQASEFGGQLKESACASIRANPLATLVGALVVGYLVGRIARL